MFRFLRTQDKTPNTKVCVIGAGFGGLTAAIKLKKDLKLNSFVVFDENVDVGGTWLINKFPGICCDVPSHMYSWSFAQNPNWSKKYASGCEILEYIQQVAAKYDLYPHIVFNSIVRKIEWMESKNQWRVSVLDKEKQEEQKHFFDFVINGTGALHLPNQPKIFDDFTRPKFHSAEFNSEIDLENKYVGIVGSGTSAAQIISSIASKVKGLYCYQRTAAWVVPKTQFEYSMMTKWIFQTFPFIMWLYRIYLFFSMEKNYLLTIMGNEKNLNCASFLRKNIQKNFPECDPKVALVTPDYDFGCKRLVVSSDYYCALAHAHVKIITDEIVGVNGDQILTTGLDQPPNLDVLILATGFQVQSFFEPMKMFGINGIDVSKTWKEEGTTTYYGVATSMAPNHFLLYGPNSACNNSVIFILECQVNYILKVIKEFMNRNAKRVTVKRAAELEFIKKVDEKMKSTVWAAGGCSSPYLSFTGRVNTKWPWTCAAYFIQTRAVDHTKYEYI